MPPALFYSRSGACPPDEQAQTVAAPECKWRKRDVGCEAHASMKTLSPSDAPAAQAASAFATSPARRAARRAAQIARLANFLYLLPMVALVGAFLLYPAADTVWISFTNWNGLNNASFVGFQNYSRLFSDPA